MSPTNPKSPPIPQTVASLSPIEQSTAEFTDVVDHESLLVTTPKSSKASRDGIVLKHNVSNEFLNPNDLSPIYKSKSPLYIDDVSCADDHDDEDGLQNIAEEDSTELDSRDFNKRKRDSFDNLSLISTDSMAPTFNSAKKPKLIRTGSITRGLRRSMSFVALKNPISNILRSRRNSVDPNSSIGSITSIESTFNESIKKPVKDKIRTLRNRIIKGTSTKRDLCITPKTPASTAEKIAGNTITTTPKRMSSTSSSMKMIRKLKGNTIDKVCSSPAVTDGRSDFKTPLAPISNHQPLSRCSVAGIEQIAEFECHKMQNELRTKCAATTTATISATVMQAESVAVSTTATTPPPIDNDTNAVVAHKLSTIVTDGGDVNAVFNTKNKIFFVYFIILLQKTKCVRLLVCCLFI